MTIRVRSAHRRVTDAPTAKAAWAMVAADTSRERSRMMLAMARRPDLTEAILVKMHKASHGDTHWLGAAARNPAVRDADLIQHYLTTPPALPVLLSHVEEYASQIARILLEWGGVMRENHPDRRMIEQAEQVIPRAVVEAAVTTALTSGDDRLAAVAARSDYFTREHWPIALDALDAEFAADRMSNLYQSLITRSDATEADQVHMARAYIDANSALPGAWRYNNLFHTLAHARGVTVSPDVVRLVPREHWNEVADHIANYGNGTAQRAFVLAGHLPSVSSNVFSLFGRGNNAIAQIVMDVVNSGADEEFAHGYMNDTATAAVEKVLARDPSPEFVRWAINWRAATYMTPVVGSDPVEDRAGVIDWLREHLDIEAPSHTIAWEPVEAWETSAEVLATHEWPEARALAATAVHASDVTDAYADPSPLVRAVLVARDDLSAAVDQPTALAMAADPDTEVRRILAANPAAPSAALLALAADASPLVRAVLAARDDLSAAVDEPTALAMAADPDAEVRRILAANPAAPSAALLALATDVDVTVRAEVSRNPSLTAEGITLLAYDSDQSIARHVTERFVDALGS